MEMPYMPASFSIPSWRKPMKWCGVVFREFLSMTKPEASWLKSSLLPDLFPNKASLLPTEEVKKKEVKCNVDRGRERLPKRKA
ncbi:Protein crossbronx-like [Clarias magur]|uniref:Protein crossbronx-like n=1 Tax=Clarias magur TaxID=1594786 RepID=A0A8J4UG47_CLAMG|nr:Protein crossbronx-like [Clarias magur]